MSWLDIVDTSIKIGLGALIAGIFALISAIVSHKHQLEKSKIETLSNAAEEISESFETTLAKIFLDGIDCAGFIIHDMNIPGDDPDAIFNALDNYEEVINKAISELYPLDGRLRLYGFSKAADILQEIIEAIPDLHWKINPEEPGGTIENFRSAFQKIGSIKIRFYSELNNKLQNSH
jgi:hypothetical protein